MKKLQSEKSNEIPVLKLITVLEDVIPTENKKIFNLLAESLKSMSSHVERSRLPQVELAWPTLRGRVLH